MYVLGDMDIKDQQIEDLLFSYFSGELTESGEKELLQWLQADEANKRLLSEKEDWWATAHVPLFRSDMKPNFKKQFGNLASPAVPIAQSTFFNLFLWGKVAASVLLLVAVGSLSYFAGKSGRSAEDTRLAYFETITPLGSQSKVILPDRSVVWVNAGSSLKYSKDFNKEEREVSLSGEAYFEVTPDSLKPFVVKSEKLDIKVLGTHFNVKAYSNEELIDVSLVSGKVKVHLTSHDANSGEVTLVPDRKLSYNKETNCVNVSEIDGSDAFAWTTGRLKFVEQFFPRIARDLERAYNVRIHINSKALNKEIFTGSFDAGSSLNEILREIDVEHKYIWTRKGDEIVIREK